MTLFTISLVLCVLAKAASWNSTCSGSIQAHLRYGCSNQSAAGLPLPTTPDETLADAVCCDASFRAFAEPNKFFQRPGINLFGKVNPSGTTTFYDSVCGIPLFVAPVGRSFQDWQSETVEHGWPSFRSSEVVSGNVKVLATGEVVSACGTHLGSYLPDAAGERFCMDLVCISGNPSAPPPPADALLVTFDGARGTTYQWRLTNDPVMGGVSTSVFGVSEAIGRFNGTVANVPSLSAPGFCKIDTQGMLLKPRDISAYSHLILKVRSSTPEYPGFKLDFAARNWTNFKTFKANFHLSPSADWQTVEMPLAGFSNDWSPYTGECDTKDPTGVQHYCCTSDHPERCVTLQDLQSIEQIGVWAEGTAGDFQIDIQSISAGNRQF